MSVRENWARISLSFPESGQIYITVQRDLQPEMFRKVLRRAIKGHVSSVKANVPVFAAKLVFQLAREFGSQRGAFVSITPIKPSTAVAWRYAFSIRDMPWLRIDHADGTNYYMGGFFKFTRKLPDSYRMPNAARIGRAKKRMSAKKSRRAHLYQPVPDFAPGYRPPMTRKK